MSVHCLRVVTLLWCDDKINSITQQTRDIEPTLVQCHVSCFAGNLLDPSNWKSLRHDRMSPFLSSYHSWLVLGVDPLSQVITLPPGPVSALAISRTSPHISLSIQKGSITLVINTNISLFIVNLFMNNILSKVQSIKIFDFDKLL